MPYTGVQHYCVGDVVEFKPDKYWAKELRRYTDVPMKCEVLRPMRDMYDHEVYELMVIDPEVTDIVKRHGIIMLDSMCSFGCNAEYLQLSKRDIQPVNDWSAFDEMFV